MLTISHTELKKRAVLTESNNPVVGKIFNNNGLYKVWNGRTYVHLGEENLARMYDNVADFPTTGEKGLLYRLRLENHFYIWDGFGYRILGDTVPTVPIHDGEYVLEVKGGIPKWVHANSYIAYVLGSTLGGDIAISPFVKFDGVTEDTENNNLDLMDEHEYILRPQYQVGMGDQHVSTTSPMFIADSFANAHSKPIVGDTGNPVLGVTMHEWIANSTHVTVVYDKSSQHFVATWV